MHAKHVCYAVRETAGMAIEMVRRMTTGSEFIIFIISQTFQTPWREEEGGGEGEWGSWFEMPPSCNYIT